MKRTIEIDDTLDEIVESAIDSVKQELLDFLETNPDTDELPCLNNDLDYSGAIHEIIDSSVPVYTGELEDTWYLYSSELESALDRAGLYSPEDLGRLDNEQKIQSAIYCYIQEQVNEWYDDNAQEVFDTWRQEHTYHVAIDVNEDGLVTVYAPLQEGETVAHNNIFDKSLKSLIESEIMEDDRDLGGLKDHLIELALIPKNAILEE